MSDALCAQLGVLETLRGRHGDERAITEAVDHMAACAAFLARHCGSHATFDALVRLSDVIVADQAMRDIASGSALKIV
jgi:hypothetical protein